MPKRRKPPRSPRRAPPLPSVGRYVLAFQSADGSMQDPPVPLDQRLTDAELRELVEAVQAKIISRAEKPENDEGTAKASPAEISAVKAEMARLFDPDGKPKISLPAHNIVPKMTDADLGLDVIEPTPAAKPTSTDPVEESWGKSIGTLLYWILSIALGGLLGGSALGVGAFYTMRALG